MLLKKDSLLSKQKDATSTFNKHFRSITYLLNLFSWSGDTSMSPGNNAINSIINKLPFHPGIKAIKKFED